MSTWLLVQRKSLSLSPSAVKTAAASSFSWALSGNQATHKLFHHAGPTSIHPSIHPNKSIPTSCRVHPDQDVVSSGLGHCRYHIPDRRVDGEHEREGLVVRSADLVQDCRRRAPGERRGVAGQRTSKVCYAPLSVALIDCNLPAGSSQWKNQSNFWFC